MASRGCVCRITAARNRARSMAITRVGYIGSRGHWQATLREISAVPALRGVALAPGGDTVAPVAQWCREHGHDCSVVDDYRRLLDDASLDVVVVCGPFEQHAAMCVDAIERGIHVLTEKPAA